MSSFPTEGHDKKVYTYLLLLIKVFLSRGRTLEAILMSILTTGFFKPPRTTHLHHLSLPHLCPCLLLPNFHILPLQTHSHLLYYWHHPKVESVVQCTSIIHEQRIPQTLSTPPSVITSWIIVSKCSGVERSVRNRYTLVNKASLAFTCMKRLEHYSSLEVPYAANLQATLKHSLRSLDNSSSDHAARVAFLFTPAVHVRPWSATA